MKRTLGGTHSSAVAVNDRHQIVGSSTIAGDAGRHATLWQSQRPLPSSKKECDNGGWSAYAVFKNQGDCVSFVTTGGRNGPAR